MNKKLMLLSIIVVVFSVAIAGCANTPSEANVPVDQGPVELADVGRLSVDNPEAEIGAPVPANLPAIEPQFVDEPDSAFDVPAPVVDQRPVELADVGQLSVDNPEAEIGAPVPANLPAIEPQFFGEPDSAFDVPAPVVDQRPVELEDVGRLSVDNPEAEIGEPVPANLPVIEPQFVDEPDSAFDVPAPSE